MSTKEKINRAMSLTDWVVSQGFEYRAEYLRDHDKLKHCAYFWITIKHNGRAVAFEQLWGSKEPDHKPSKPHMLDLFYLYQKLGQTDRVFGHNTEALNLFIVAQLGNEQYQQFLNCKE